MRVGVIGINHKQAAIELRDLLAKACQRRFTSGFSLHPSHHTILLSTCNRTEIYFSSENLAETHSYLLSIIRKEISEEFEQRLYSFFGIDCFLHLSRVAGGLDSALLGETEIQGQVRASYETAHRHTKLPKELHFLFQKALKNGKLIRSLLPKRPEGIEDLIYSIGKENTPHLDTAEILIVGASQINLKILRSLKLRRLNLTLTNRTLEKGMKWAKELQVGYLPFEKLSSWKHFDWIICGTKSPAPLIDLSKAPSKLSSKLIFDLSVPRNAAGEHPSVSLFHIDALHQKLTGSLPHLATKEAERELEKSVLRQLGKRGFKLEIHSLIASN